MQKPYSVLIGTLVFMLALLAVIAAFGVISFAAKKSGVDPLAVAAYKSLTSLSGEEDVAPTPSPPRTSQLTDVELLEARPQAVMAIVDSVGRCMSIHLRDGNLRACEDQPDWRRLPTEIDRGQFFRGESLD